VTTARNTTALYEEAVRISYRRLDEGQASSFDIIEQQRRLYDARSRELAAQAELNRSITQLWLVTGTILERTGVGFIPDKRELKMERRVESVAARGRAVRSTPVPPAAR
jgi:hypothetical protein